MSAYRELMRQVAAATDADEQSVERVRARLDARLQPTTALLRAIPEPTRAAENRVRMRLRRQARTSRLAWIPVAGLGLAAAAAAAIAVLPERATVDGGAPPQLATAPVDLPLAAARVAIADHVRLDPRGQGAITGQAPSYAITWEHGTIGVDVTPNAGLDVSVRTPEAVVHVVGTVFDVTRDRLGTTVAVTHGQVSVDCALGEDVMLTAGEAHTCWPATAAGLLGRARGLQEIPGALPRVLDTVELALERPDATGAVRAELLAAGLSPLVELGRHADALSYAEAYLADGGTRPEIRRYAALLALGVDGCARAVPHLEALPDRSPEEEAALSRCRAQ